MGVVSDACESVGRFRPSSLQISLAQYQILALLDFHASFIGASHFSVFAQGAVFIALLHATRIP